MVNIRIFSMVSKSSRRVIITIKHKRAVENDTELDTEDLKCVVAQYKQILQGGVWRSKGACIFAQAVVEMLLQTGHGTCILACLARPWKPMSSTPLRKLVRSIFQTCRQTRGLA